MKRRPTIREGNGDASQPADSEPWNDPALIHEELADDVPELEEPSDLDSYDLVDIDDKHWDVFIVDDDEGDALPDYGDFWMPD
jgi:hypothetical protein